MDSVDIPLTPHIYTLHKNVVLYRFVVQFGLQLLGVCHLPHSFHEILLSHIIMVRTNGKHTCGTKRRRRSYTGETQSKVHLSINSC